MHPRQNTVEIFSTFIQFEYDRFGGWATDTRLRRSMISLEASVASSADFWALYWHQIWLKQPQSIAKEHLAAYLQEVCFWSANRTISGFSTSQYTLPDCFQIAIARTDKVLGGFDRELGSNLRSYASITFSNTIRELLRQQKEIDICSDWSLLRKLSQKKLSEALANEGLWPDTIEQYILAWNCFKILYVPERIGSTRKLSQPNRATWEAIAKLYNRQRHTIVIKNTINEEQIAQWLVSCAKAGRSYLFPQITSINQPKPGYDTGEIVDSIVGEIDESLLSEMIASETAQQRMAQRAQIDGVLTEALAQLQPAEQKLLKLYYSGKLNQVEIAQELDTQQYKVSRKLSRIRKSLLKALAEWSQRLLRAEPSAQSLAKQDDGALAPQTTEPALTDAQSTMHISLTSDILGNISSLLEEWLAGYYSSE